MRHCLGLRERLQSDAGRAKAALRLAALGDRRAVQPLMLAWQCFPAVPPTPTSLVADLYRQRLRVALVTALGRLGDSRAAELLVTALSDTHKVRCAALTALGLIGDRRVVPAVASVLEAEMRSHFDIRGCHFQTESMPEAIEALRQLGDARALEALVGVLQPGFAEHLANYHTQLADEFAVAAARALGSLGDARARGELIRALGSGNGDLRATAASALAALGEPEWQGLVQGGLDDFERLAHCRDSRALEPLINGLVNGGFDVRRTAAEALGAFGDPRAKEPLLVAMGDWIPQVRRAAAGALAQLGDQVWVNQVKGDLGDFDRMAACGPRAATPLIGALQQYKTGESGLRDYLIDRNPRRGGDEQVRRAAQEALVALKNADTTDEDTRRIIRRALKTEHALVEAKRKELIASIAESKATDERHAAMDRAGYWYGPDD